MPKGKHAKDKQLVKHPLTPLRASSLTMSPELIDREDITPPNLSPPHSALSSPESVPDQATTVAQEVSRLLLPLFDKRLDMLHASINSALAQITTNAQKIVDLETRVVACESSATTVEYAMSHHQNANIILSDKLEDLENRERRNKLRFIGVSEEVTGDNRIHYLVADLPSAL